MTALDSELQSSSRIGCHLLPALVGLGRPAALAAALLFPAACDAIYHARISASLDATDSLDSERVAADLISSLESQFALTCRETEHPIITGTYRDGPWQLTECSELHHYTDLLVAPSEDRIAIEIQEIAGASETSTFRALRQASLEMLEAAVPGAEIQVEFPYKPPPGGGEPAAD